MDSHLDKKDNGEQWTGEESALFDSFLKYALMPFW